MDIKTRLKEYARTDDIEGKFAYFHNYKKMPRTMLRYGVERFDEDLRQDFLKGRI